MASHRISKCQVLAMLDDSDQLLIPVNQKVRTANLKVMTIMVIIRPTLTALLMAQMTKVTTRHLSPRGQLLLTMTSLILCLTFLQTLVFKSMFCNSSFIVKNQMPEGFRY